METKNITLALQGGGAHGAFTWGVLDRLLEEPRLVIEAISGASAGAVNGAVLSFGLATGGPTHARVLLDEFWSKVSTSALFSPIQPGIWERMLGTPNLEWSPSFIGFDIMMRLLSPYQFNPLGFNPLRDLLADAVDFDFLRRLETPRLFIAATNVTKGRLKLFYGEELSVDALLASTCLPFLFHAVKIGEEYYWDGGFIGNPPLYPLVHNCRSSDIIIIQVFPISRAPAPTLPTPIIDRMTEISCNSTLLLEARGISRINKVLEMGGISGTADGLHPVHLHMIGAEQQMAEYTVASKLNADRAFLLMLRDLGRNAADEWLESNFDSIGRETTFVMDQLFA
ncbi:NTE family protein [Azospirillaceae bacterium]